MDAISKKRKMSLNRVHLLLFHLLFASLLVVAEAQQYDSSSYKKSPYYHSYHISDSPSLQDHENEDDFPRGPRCELNIALGYINKTESSNGLDRRYFDTAWLTIINNSSVTVNYTWQNSECYKCPLFWMTMQPGTNCTHVIQSAYKNHIAVKSVHTFGEENMTKCRGWFRENGRYSFNVGPTWCHTTLHNHPKNPDLPFLYVSLFWIGLAAVYVILHKLYSAGVFDRFIPINKFKSRSRRISCIEVEKQAVTINGTSEKHSKIDKITAANNANQYSTINHSYDKSIEHTAASSDTGKDLEVSDQTHQNGGISQHTMQNGKPPEISDVERVSSQAPVPATVVEATSASTPAARLASLDAFRGFSLILMVFINYNYGGAIYWYIIHAPWNGLTVGDTVFPWFLWMMGTSMVFSFRGVLKSETPWYLVVWKIFFRSCKLFVFHLILQRNLELKTIRIPGVLQRFAFVYLFNALVYYPFAKLATQKNMKNFLSDILVFWLEWLIHFAMLAVYLALTFALPVPGCPTGYLGPGGLHEFGHYYNCIGGAAGYADLKLLTANHIFQWPTSQGVYRTTQNEPFDPEGFFTVIPTLFLCLLGSQAGKTLAMNAGKHKQILIRWFIWAVVCCVIGVLLCGGKQEGGWIPINKNLWSMSFIFIMAGTGFALLAIMYVVIDVLHIWNGAPFIYPGKNSILIYICQTVFGTYLPVTWYYDRTSHSETLIVVTWSCCFWCIVAYILDRKKIYLTL